MHLLEVQNLTLKLDIIDKLSATLVI